MRIAVVSDEPLLAEFVRRALGPSFTVDAHRDLAAIASASAIERPDVAIVARRIGSVDSCTALGSLGQTPLVLASPDDTDRALTLSHHAAFLPIPFATADLLHAIGAATRKTKLLLVADDSVLIHRHTTPILEEAGYDVLEAYDGEQALLLHQAHHPDLLITDVEMPKLDGYSLCKEIKQRDPHLPVIICSGLGDAHDLEKGFDAGADDYLVKPAAPEELCSRVRSLFSSLSPGAREHILVVDDSPTIRHLVADALSRQGFSITRAADGKAALQTISDGPRPDLVITDYDMPHLTGFELVHAIKRNPQTREIPVLMLTARDSRRDQAQMRAVGLTSYLVKPFSVDKCVAIVERMLAEHRLLAYKVASRHYISDGAAHAAEVAAESGDPVAVRAEEREVAVLFSDICGFTPLAGHLAPRKVVELLNGFFDVMCPILREEAGDIDKFIGDAIMAVFEDRPSLESAALRAVRAGLHMQRALATDNAAYKRDLGMRIGINSGTVVRGDIGSRHFRRDFTVVGDVVNRAQRFEANAPRGGVLIGPRTYELVRERVRVEERPALALKGVAEPVKAYLVLELLDEPRRATKESL